MVESKSASSTDPLHKDSGSGAHLPPAHGVLNQLQRARGRALRDHTIQEPLSKTAEMAAEFPDG